MKIKEVFLQRYIADIDEYEHGFVHYNYSTSNDDIINDCTKHGDTVVSIEVVERDIEIKAQPLEIVYQEKNGRLYK